MLNIDYKIYLSETNYEKNVNSMRWRLKYFNLDYDENIGDAIVDTYVEDTFNE